MFEHNVTSIKQQLLFKMSVLFGNNDSIKYKTEALQSSEIDYRFLLSSLNSSGCEESAKILHVFKISPADGNEVRKVHNSSLYLQGVTANKIINILTSGYPKTYKSSSKRCKEECFAEDVLRSNNCFCYASNLFE